MFLPHTHSRDSVYVGALPIQKWRFLTISDEFEKHQKKYFAIWRSRHSCYSMFRLLQFTRRWYSTLTPVKMTQHHRWMNFGPWAGLLLKGKVSLGMVPRPPSTLPSGSASGGVIPRKDRRCRHRRTFPWHWLSGNHQCCTLAIHSQHHIYNIQCNSSTLR